MGAQVPDFGTWDTTKANPSSLTIAVFQAEGRTCFCLSLVLPILRVPLDKDEGFVKAQITCAVRERRGHRQRG